LISFRISFPACWGLPPAEFRSLGLQRVRFPHRFVRCAVTGIPIPLEELKYRSVDLQEAYASPDAVLQRHVRQRHG
jgi:hypothetical protein